MREILFYVTERGESPVQEFIDGLSIKEQAKWLSYARLLQEHGNTLPSQYIKHIEGDLWELRPEFGGVEMRFFYFVFTPEAIMIVHAVKKKSQKVRPRDVQLAVKRMNDVRLREVEAGEAEGPQRKKKT